MPDKSKIISIPLKTLTPIWTGGASTGKVDRLRETGIIGSMRWWFEVLVRGVGGCVNDPNDPKNSGLDVDAFNKLSQAEKHDRYCLLKAGLCDVSRIFGTTNWKRQFRLQVIDSTIPDENIAEEIYLDDKRYQKLDRQGNLVTVTPKWFFRGDLEDMPREGDFTLRIVPLSVDFDPAIIKGLIQFIADWAALGARAQMGFGVIEMNRERLNSKPLFDHLKGLHGAHVYPNYLAPPNYPSLDDFFFAKIRKKNGSAFVEIDPFLLKYDLRRLFSDNKKIRHFVMGSIQETTPYAAKVSMSRPYDCDGNSTIRLWGWIPASGSDGKPINNQALKKIIYNHLSTHYEVVRYESLTQHNGTEAPKEDITTFLETLFSIEQKQESAHA